MNRILLLLSFSLLFLTNCKQDEDPVALSIAGTWKPVKMVETIVINGGQPDSNTYVYDDCQQMSRFVFNADLSGKVKKASISFDIISNNVLRTDAGLDYLI